MPKSKTKLSTKLQDYVKEFGNDFKTDKQILFCNICEVAVSTNQRSQVIQHLTSDKHKKRKTISTATEQRKQQFIIDGLSGASSIQSVFNKDLCNALLSADIPLAKLNNDVFKQFLEKYTGKIVPAVSTLRTNCVKDLYDSAIRKIKEAVRGQFVWISIDETTDIQGRYVANVIIGVLSADEDLSKKKNFF